MPRQNPNLLGSAANLRGAAAAIRAAVGSGTFEDLKAALTAAAGAFEQAEASLSGIEQRLRDVGEANVNDPRRPAGLLVSGDRIRGGVQVQGGLRSVPGQGMDLTFETQVSHVKSYDHGADGYLELDIDASAVAINAHGGAITLTGTITLAMTTLGDTVYGGTAGVVTRLAGNTTSTRKFLRQTGTGTVSAAPAWDTVDAGDVTSGTLAVARGGTGSATGSITGTGALAFKPGTNSTTAIQLQNAAGTAVVDVDTSNARVGVGLTPTAAKVEVLAEDNFGIRSISASNAAVFGLYVTENNTDNRNWAIRNRYNVRGMLEFVVSTAQALDPATVALVIDRAGNVGVGGTTVPTSVLHVVGLPVYANNAAAVTGGLTAGALYRVNADPDTVAVVH